MSMLALVFLSISYMFYTKNSHSNNIKISDNIEPRCEFIDPLLDMSIIKPIENISSAATNFAVVKEAQSLHSILKFEGIAEHEIMKIGLILKPYFLAKDLAAGDLYQFSINKDSSISYINNLMIKKLDINRVPILYNITRINKDDINSAFNIEVIPASIAEKYRLLSFVVNGSLYKTFNQTPFGGELMQKLMNILLWKLKMPKDILSDDRIVILVKEKWAEGKMIGYGDIEKIIYTQHHQQFIASYFISSDQKISGFFDENGDSLEKEFLSSPVKEAITTSEQKWRFHPIRKIRVRHNGIDFRGTIGTEFFAIADGKIIEKRFDKNVGNMIRIEHKYGVYSEYFHAHTLDNKLNEGSVVKRGQLLGTIGRSGKLCTGPHLHLGLYKMYHDKRKYIELSSLRNILKSAPGINDIYKNEYQAHLATQLALIEKQKQHEIVASSSLTMSDK